MAARCDWRRCAAWNSLRALTGSRYLRWPHIDTYIRRAYAISIRVEWDPDKARENRRKHDVDFADAAIALEDESALSIEDRDHVEVRFKTLGMGPQLKVLLVVYTIRTGGRIRIISARRATRTQTRQYFKGIEHD